VPLRLFVASSFSQETAAAIDAVARELRRSLPRASWVRPESMHLTYAFLGDQPEALVEPLSQRLAAALSSLQPFDVELGGAGFFPSAARPRVGWLALEPREPLVAVAAAVREAVGSEGVELDRKSFEPHLTVVRLREPWPRDDTGRFSAVFETFRTSDRVASVVVYSSRLEPGGAVHTPLATIALGAG
jgi:RNA 2',3'-cyclic 3'-phosphodiesterase